MFHQRRWRVGMAGGLLCCLISACAATMQSSPVEVAAVAPDEGIVVGSVLIETDELPKDESALAFLAGRKMSGPTYAVTMTRAYRSVIGKFFRQEEYSLVGLRPDEEIVFVKTLPAGVYRIDRIDATGFMTKHHYGLSVFFTVEPGGRSYIGKFIFQLLGRTTEGSGARMMVGNDQEKTLAALGKEYTQSLTGLTSNLMTISGPRLVPGDTETSAE
jgi:hypothetical protein